LNRSVDRIPEILLQQTLIQTKIRTTKIKVGKDKAVVEAAKITKDVDTVIVVVIRDETPHMTNSVVVVMGHTVVVEIIIKDEEVDLEVVIIINVIHRVKTPISHVLSGMLCLIKNAKMQSVHEVNGA
jgi:hypothetical protein